MPKPRIMIVDDEIIVVRDLEMWLKARGYEVVGVAPSGEVALRIMEDARPDLILMDVVLKGKLDGVETAERIHVQREVPIIFLTAYRGIQNLVPALVSGLCWFIVKPFALGELQPVIEKALRNGWM